MNTNPLLISEDLKSNPIVFRIVKYLIDNNKTEYIPYRAYREPFVYRIELENENRMDHIDMQKIRVLDLPQLIKQEMQWLYKVLWSQNIIHGDLTNNNIIYQDGKFYFIDWELSDIVPGNVCGLWYIFTDMIDFLNVFYQLLPEMFENVYKVSKTDFDTYYNIIKNQESFMKDNDATLAQCIEAFKNNVRTLETFVAFIRRATDIELTHVINNLIRIYGIGGKRRVKKQKNKTKKRTRRTRTLKSRTKK